MTLFGSIRWVHRILKGLLPHSLIDGFLSSVEGEPLTPHAIQKESVQSRLLSFRFLNAARVAALREPLEPFLQKEFGLSEPMFLCPLFYLRICHPNVFISKKHEKAFLYTEPHYDLAYGMNGFSFWIPFQETDDQTGTLCTFAKPVIEEFSSRPEQNRFNITKYLQESESIDPLLREHARPLYLKSGDAVLFDREFLHGATKPVSKPRISLNIRFLSQKEVFQASTDVQNLVFAFNKDIDGFNTKNIQALRAEKAEKLSWRDEYRWFFSADTVTVR